MITDLGYLGGLQQLITAYEEIAANRMQKIRQGVLSNREFMIGLGEVFQIVKVSYQKEVTAQKLVIDRGKNNQTARVLVAANTGLYGDIIQRVFHLFKKDLQTKGGQAVVIGTLGKSLAESAYAPKNFAYFDFPDTGFDREAAQKLVGHLLPFEKVVVYHGLFKNILMQTEKATSLTGDEPLPWPAGTPAKRLIFEPHLGKILYFFETEIFSSLLVQALYEGQLAKFSARMASLDEATEKIKEATKLALLAQAKEKHRLHNKKQLDMLVSRMVWEN